MLDAPAPNSLVHMGGGLCLAGVVIGLAILILCCAGFDAALAFSPLPIILGIGGGVMTLIASWRKANIPESSTLIALFIALLAVLGGLLETAAWLHWAILFNQLS